MPDIASISAVINSVKAASDIARLIKESDSTLEKAELKLQLADLIGSLADAKLSLTDVQDTVAAKDEEIAELRTALEFKDKLERYGDAYYLLDENGQLTGAPFCMHCWQANNIQRLLHQKAGDRFTNHCSPCGTEYSGRLTRPLRPESA